MSDPNLNLTDSDKLILKVLKENQPMSTGHIGLAAWGEGKNRQPQAYAMPAGKILRKLREMGLVELTDDMGFPKWRVAFNAKEEIEHYEKALCTGVNDPRLPPRYSKWVSRKKCDEVSGGRTRFVTDYTWGGDICYREFYGPGKYQFTERKCTLAEWLEYQKHARKVWQKE